MLIWRILNTSNSLNLSALKNLMHKVISDCADLKIKMAFFKGVHSCVPLNLDSCG